MDANIYIYIYKKNKIIWKTKTNNITDLVFFFFIPSAMDKVNIHREKIIVLISFSLLKSKKYEQYQTNNEIGFSKNKIRLNNSNNLILFSTSDVRSELFTQKWIHIVISV